MNKIRQFLESVKVYIHNVFSQLKLIFLTKNNEQSIENLFDVAANIGKVFLSYVNYILIYINFLCINMPAYMMQYIGSAVYFPPLNRRQSKWILWFWIVNNALAFAILCANITVISNKNERFFWVFTAIYIILVSIVVVV